MDFTAMLLAGFITVYLPVKVAQSHVSRIGFVAGELHRRLLQLFLRLPSQYPLGNHQRLPVLLVNDTDNDTLRKVPHPSNEGLALQARVKGS